MSRNISVAEMGARTLLAEDGIVNITEMRVLNAEEVDRHLQSSDAIRCIITCHLPEGYYQGPYGEEGPRWLLSPERDTLWEKEIRPRLSSGNMKWDGFYDAWEWRTDQQELIIVFAYGFVPI